MVAFDAVGPAGGAGTHSSTSPLTWTHVNSGNSIVITAICSNSPSSAPTAVTYGGVTIPLLKSQAAGNSATYVFGLIGASVPTGTNTASVSFGTSGVDWIGSSVSASSAGQFGTAVSASSTAANTISATVAGTVTGGLVFAATSFGGGAGVTGFTGVSGVTIRWSINVSNSFAGDCGAGGTVASTGGGASQSAGIASNDTNTDNMALVVVEIQPPGTAATPPVTSARRVSRRYKSPHIRTPWVPQAAPPSGPVAPVAVSDTETFSAADNSPAIGISDTETASATESASPPPATLSSAETASATEGTGVIAVSSGESASAAETQLVSVAISSAETASAAEAQALTVLAAETATGTDAASPPPATLSSAETGTGTESGVIAVSDSDSFAATETASASVPVSSSDSFAAADAASPPPATLSSAEVASAAEGSGPIALAGSETASAADAAATSASLSATETASAADAAVTVALASTEAASAAEAQALAVTVSSADLASASEGTPVIALSSAETGTAVDGGEGGTGGAHVSDTDSWHGEDSGFTFITDAETATTAEGSEQFHPRVTDAFAMTEVETSFWRADSESARATDALRTLTGPAVSDSDAASMAEGVGPFFFSDTDSFAGADHPATGDSTAYLDVWSGAAPYRHTQAGFQVVAPSGRVVVTTTQLDPHFLALAALVAGSPEVVFVHDAELAAAGEGTVLANATVSVTTAKAVTVTCALSKRLGASPYPIALRQIRHLTS